MIVVKFEVGLGYKQPLARLDSFLPILKIVAINMDGHLMQEAAINAYVLHTRNIPVEC